MFPIRVRLGITTALTAALSTLNCSNDATTPPQTRPFTFSVAPAFQSAGAAGLVDVDQIRFVVVRSADGDTVLDTTVDVQQGSDEVQVDLTVTVSSPGEVFLLSLTLFDLSGNVVFTGGPVEVTATTDPNATPPQIEVALTYVGVGADAVAVFILLPDTSVLFGETVELAAEAVNDLEQPIPGTPIGWSSANSFAQVADRTVGQAVAGNQRGVAQIIATLLTGPADTVDIFVRNIVIVPVAGTNREGLVGRILPVDVQVVDDLNQPLPNSSVTFAASDGTLSPNIAVTDAQGLARTSWTLPSVEGSLTLDVTLTDLPQVTTTVSAAAILPTLVPVSDGQRGAAGVDVPAIIQVLGPNSVGVAGLDVVFSTTDGQIAPTTLTTDTSGFAQATWTLGSTIGMQTAAVSLPEFPNVSSTLNATVFVPPPPGADVVVFNDMNIFDETAMQDPNNKLLVRNLVSFTGQGPRAFGDVVWFDRGRSSTCFNTSTIPEEKECGPIANATMTAEIESTGLLVEEVSSDTLGTANVDPGLKVLFLWNPTVPFTTEEIFAFQQFAFEGGRLVFIGEHDGFYPAEGIATENQLLAGLGAQMTNTGGAIDCLMGIEDPYPMLPASSILLGHQVTAGLTGLTIACASVIQPGTQDFPFMYDLSNTQVLAGVAVIPLGAPPPDISSASAERQQAFDDAVRRLRATRRAVVGSSSTGAPR